MATEQGLYAQVVKMIQKYLKFIEEIGIKMKLNSSSKVNLQDNSVWFYLDFDWIGVNFSTREPDFYKETFQIHDDTQDTNKFKFFQVSIGS